MSIRYVAAVLDRLTHLRAPERLVLIALADFASDDTRESWPSVATLMRRSSLSRRGVQTILRRLELADLIEVARGGVLDGKNTTSCYRLRFAYDGEHLPPQEKMPEGGGARRARGGAHGVRGGGARDAPRGAHGVRPIRYLDPSLNQRAIENREPEKATRGEAAKSLAAIYEKLGKTRRAKQIKGEGEK